jgi:hypothetical protein
MTVASAVDSSTASSDCEDEPPERFRLGVLFVHGMGEQVRGDTITEMGDAVTEWLRRWLEPGADFKIRSAQLRTGDVVPSGPSDSALGGQAHVVVTIDDKTPGSARSQKWLLAESWWAGAFRQATFMEVAIWAVAAGPWLIASQRAGIGKRGRAADKLHPPTPIRRFASGATALLLTLIAALVAAVITPLALGLLLLSLIPIPVLSDLTRGIVKNLSGSFGDLLILVRSPVRFAAMAEQVRSDIAHVSAQCDALMVVAHSQGSAVSWHAIRRISEQDEKCRAEVALFLSFGQALRKLKALYLLRRAPGSRQAIFFVLALASTIFLAWAALQGIGFAGLFVDRRGEFSQVLRDGLDELLWIVGTLGVVIVIQGFLGSMATDNETEAEEEVVDEIGKVRNVLRNFRWTDLWGSADPAPNGPLLSEMVPGVRSYRVRNRSSTLLDHSVYWTNTTEFVSAVAFAGANLVSPNALGVESSIPKPLQDAALVRNVRVSMLASGRVALFTGLAAFVYGVRRLLPDWGGWLLDSLNSIPLMPDWFGGWDHTFKGYVAAFAITIGAFVAWGVIGWAWNLATRRDEKAFFARTAGSSWTPAATAWLLAALAVPTAVIVALAIIRPDWSVLVVYAVLAVSALVAVWMLNSREPNLAQIDEPAEPMQAPPTPT